MAGWKAENSSTQAADIVKKLMSLISEEIKLEYDQYGMEIVAKDLCPDRWLNYMKCEWGRVPQKEWPSPCVFFCFKNANGNLSQVITLRKLSWSDNLIQLGADLVVETKTGFLSLSDYLTLKMIREEGERIKEAKEKEKIPELKSFCGISFGSVLKGDLERTDDGRYLTGCVKLKKPFRGVEYALVYVGIKSRKIFRIVIETNDMTGVINDILAKKYNPDKKKAIGTWGHFKLKNSSIEVRDKDVFRDVDSVTLSAKVRMVNPENWITTIAVMDALHETYKSIADQEYEEESGGDGSAVL